MQTAIDHLENTKVYVEALEMEMVPINEARKAIELSIDSQLAEAMRQIEQVTNIQLTDEIDDD